MKKIIRITESDISRIVRKVIREQNEMFNDPCQAEIDNLSKEIGDKLPSSCMGADISNECINEILDMAAPFSYPAEKFNLLGAIGKLDWCKKENPDYYNNSDYLWGEQGV